tara:strand:- start:1918 stop:2142 length:225 start_codon:yes stop_codon:yes gene_type:complete
LVVNHIEKIDEIQEKVISDSEKILPSIDIDDLLKEPQKYLLKVSLQFLNNHIEEIKQGEEQGKRFAKQILKDIG